MQIGENSSVILSDSSFGDQIVKLKKEAAEDVKHKLPTLNPSRSAILNDIKRSVRRSQAMARKREEEQRMIEEGKTKEQIDEARKKEKEEEIRLIEVTGVIKKTAA